ncbi:hypothetical protein MBLNU230_g7591t1 [Neophaeotheca triangularis]
MTNSTKKKNEKKKDFQKPKLKVGKARPTNTNATDTSFTAKSIVLKQQSLSEGGRDPSTLFKHNLSLLSSKADQQRRDALAHLTTAALTTSPLPLPVPAETIVTKAQPLILDSSSAVRSQLLKLLRALPPTDLSASIEPLLLYTRAGLSHLSSEIRLSSLETLDWLLTTNGSYVVSAPGGWVKTLRQFQNLLQWHHSPDSTASHTNTSNNPPTSSAWTTSKPTNNKLNTSAPKLLTHQLTTLTLLLQTGLTPPPSPSKQNPLLQEPPSFPLSTDHKTHTLSKSNPYGYLNLFGAPRDVESEVYGSWEERREVFENLGLEGAFLHGVGAAKREAGEVGRVAGGVEKVLRLGKSWG